MLFKKKSNELSGWMQINAPTVLFWVAAVILVLFDARVLDVTWKLTTSYLLTVGAIFATGLMFFMWKIGFGYTLANKTQVTLSSIGMAISLLASAVFGGMDYFVRGGLVIDSGANEFTAIDLLFWGVPVLSVIHVVMLLVFWYVDPVITAARKKKEADDDAKFADDAMTQANDLLEKRDKLLARYVQTAQMYGRQAADDQLDALGIDKAQFANVVIPAVTGHGSGQEPSMTEQPIVHDRPAQITIPVHDQAFMTVPVMAGGNGHGKVVNPTKAA